ncbi:MAG: PASTA domain-containing protein, partial [Bacilli bacterium]|nr:PASTA domain-containing protein [Bacilli bacterium]
MKKVPELKNELLEDAKEILDKSGIPYEENEEREFSLTVRRGRVIRTEPKENEEIRNDEKVTIYVSKLWLLPFILIFILLLLLSIVMGIGVSKIYSNNRPIIESTYQGWVQKNVVYVKKDANVSEIDTYFYCVTKSKRSNKCEWKETKTKNTLLSESGKWNVFFKARYKNGKYSYISNRKEVLIDNNAPIINSITKNISSNSFSFDIKARDLESGIKSYSYKIGNKGYIEVDNKFTISKLDSNTEYTITIKIQDNAGNVYDVTFTERTKDKSSTTTPDNNENDDKTTSNSNEESTTNDNTTTTTTKGEGNTNTTKSTKTTNKTTSTEKTKPVEPVVEIPKIDLNDLPSEFEYGEDYKLPSHVEFGPSGGTYSCALDHDWSINVESTKDFAVGKYTVSCKAVSNTGSYAEVSKDIKVNVPTGEDEEWDGWIRLNLYYPKKSVNREWRLHRDGEIRGEDDDWQPYTGPILVKVSDVENIYIRYDIDGEKRIDVTTGKVLVDIQANKLSLKGNETTKVNIVFDKNAITKEYRINGSDWREYTSEFNVAADTLIEARATREENVYDDDGNIIMTKTLVGSDALYISEIKDSEGNGTVDFGTVNIEIKAEKTILTGNEKTNVEIEYEENSISRMYKIDNSPWLEYTGAFTVSANQTIYASATKQKSVTLSDGTVRNGIASGSAKKTIRKSTNGGSDNPGEPGDNPDNPGESEGEQESKLTVRIITNSNSVLKGKKATIKIRSNEANSHIYYSLDNENYIEYTGSFEVEGNTHVYAYAEYEGKYAYDILYIGSITVPDRLEGPVISINPTSTAEKTTVTISTKEEAKNIYYSFDGGVYKTYTEPFEVTKNGIVRAYYIRSDNKKSETSYYYVQNIRGKNKPYVRIDAKPSIYLSEDVKMVEVVISGSNYDTLEYSYNGIEYFPYTTPLEITRSRSVYAKGKNSFGETIEKLNITTAIAPTPIEKLDVAITLTPEEKDLEELIDRVEVTINYDERATSKYYRLGSGDLIPYTGPFTVEENTTIYAYAISDNGSGSARKQINYLTTGIANPIINVIPTTPNSWVRVEIEYASTASVKKYKLDDGEWLDYTMPIELVTNNTKVYAYNEDTLGHHEESSYLIDNIIPKENISVLDNGMYYLIRLNYPSSSNPSDREYKWRKDGIWKKYDEKGILIIRPEYKDKVIGADGVKIIDSNGKEIIIKDHYYVLDVPLSEMAENLFMRWNLDKPSTPTFTLSTDDWTKEVTIAINYDNSSVDRLYKIVYEDGEDTGWLDYKEPVVIDKNNAIIYAKSINDVEIQSEIGSKKITNIDIEKPIISDVNVIKKGSSNFTIEVDALDEISKVDVYMYSLNNKDFETSTNNTYTFKKLKKSTEYKVYVKVRDKAGNISDTYEKTVVTDDIGEVSYLLDKEDWATEKVLTINYPSDIYNGYTYEYSLDLGETWLTYESPLGIKDNNTTVIARVVDGDNIKVASSFTITKIDPVIPTISLDALPSVISKDKEYNLPSSYTDGISGSVRTCKVPDRDNNFTNSSELPTGKYTLTCTITTGAGVSASVSKDISVSNATIKGDSVLSIIQDNNLKAGYYDFEIVGTDEVYPVHLITYDGNQEWTSNKTFGDAADVGTASTYAQNMVIVKVNGDVTIDEGVTVSPYYNSYGGPKGFTLYVTGKLTNKGTIDNSHGAKAEGQNV